MLLLGVQDTGHVTSGHRLCHKPIVSIVVFVFLVFVVVVLCCSKSTVPSTTSKARLISKRISA